MSFFSRVKSFLGFTEASKSAAGLLSGVLQSGKAPTRGTKELLQAYRTHPWFHAVVWRIADEFSQHVGFDLYRSKKAARAPAAMKAKSIGGPPADAVLVEDHPLIALLANPSPIFTRAVFFQLLSAFLDTKGECVIVIERGEGGQPKELWIVPPHWVADVPHAGFSAYRFSYGAWQRTIPEEDVIYLRHPELENPYARGTGTGETLADELDIDEFATKHLKTWFFNRALPDAFLSVEGVESEEEAKRYEEKLRGKHGGKTRGFQVHVTSGKVDVKELGHTFREQQLPELREQQRDTVRQVYGVPPEVMGIVENSNRATIEAAVFIFLRFVITPRLSFAADAFTHWARREWKDESLCLCFENITPEDRTFALSVMEAQADLFSKNEWRALAGREPIPGWDGEFPERAAPALPMGTAPALEEGEDAEDGEGVVEGEVVEEDDEEETRGVRGLLRLVGSSRPRRLGR